MRVEQERNQGVFRRALRRLTASEQQLDAEDLVDDVDETGATPCREAAAHERDPLELVGRLRSVRFMPRATLPTLEAELYDGSGSVTLIWLGRRRIAGIEPGRRVLVRGRVVAQGLHTVMYNPWYELRPVAP